ncbi:SGNH/GDSL hydrolase family protein [Trebonia sp.]|uniref:SGNH/GDSL hydrolase family protein n=1 Tax=Trebonia sp. TaxID=2767075 RepID=UPI0026375815|nr:SGNH/GDSL hydrolase family protein [Trebonia sp.]
MPRLTHAIAAAAAALALTSAVAVPASASQLTASHPSPKYYLSLGDSLSVGVQPNAKGVDITTDQGYANQLYKVLKRADSALRLVKLGCPGETSETLNKGGICGYKGDERYSLTADKGSQLAAALAFLHSHPGQVPLITIDIGANDLNGCIALGVISKIVTCLTPVFAALQKNLATTLAALRPADPKATIVGMTYYDPELADWLTGTSGEEFAEASIVLASQFGELLTGVYKAAGAAVADVFTAFDTTDTKDIVTVPHIGKLPKDVALICRWTWECAPKPVGPNEHANIFGYGVIAGTFLATLRGIHFPV